MRLILGYLLSPFYLLTFGLLLLIFHPLQVISRRIFGNEARKRVADALNYSLTKSQFLIGSRMSFSGFEKLPKDRPLIVVSNHQSTFDISPIGWGFRKHSPKFISKIELGKGIPSISYNLVHGGSALIDRKNRGQSIKEIIKLGRLIEKENHAACIFPEGTRSKTGKVNKFQEGGIHSLLRAAPSSIIVPFVIDGNSEVIEKGYYPLKVGVRLKFTVLDPIDPKEMTAKEIAEKVEFLIKQELGQA